MDFPRIFDVLKSTFRIWNAEKIFVTKSLLSNPFLESTFPSKKSLRMGSQKQSVGFLKITYGNRELYKVAKIKLMFTRVFYRKTKNLLMSEKTWSLASKNQFSKSWKQFVIFVFVPSLKGEHEIKIPFLLNNNTYNLYFQRNTFEMYLYFVYKGLEIIMTGSSFWTSMQKATELSWGLLFSRNI